MAYPREVKAAAMTDLLSGMPPTQVAAKHGINYKTVFHWSSELPIAVPNEESFQSKKEQIGDLIIDLLTTNLIIAKQLLTTVGNDAEWIKRQSASDLGVLYGIITDKTATIASILTAASNTPQLPAPSEPTEVDPYQDGNVSGIIEVTTDGSE